MPPTIAELFRNLAGVLRWFGRYTESNCLCVLARSLEEQEENPVITEEDFIAWLKDREIREKK